MTAPPPPSPPVSSAGAGSRPTTMARLVRFGVVGGLSAALDLGLLVALRELGGLPVALATTIAFWTALLVNFGLNRAWSFGAGGGGVVAVGVPFARYMVLVGINYAATLAIVTGGVALGVPYALAKVVAIGLGAMWTYVAYDRWVFA
ncbi:MAG TPA: GtrA family protein [Euzebya sp.]|nr:GtrA family protein [Euzebya sp.]